VTSFVSAPLEYNELLWHIIQQVFYGTIPEVAELRLASWDIEISVKAFIEQTRIQWEKKSSSPGFGKLIYCCRADSEILRSGK